MSIKHGLLALLERGPHYGYQLHADFEASTGAAWPLNIGQVYATLARLQRDGLVRETGETGPLGKVTYAITDRGRQELARWFDSAVDPSERPRDELAVKVALAVTTPGADVRRVLQAQRTATLKHLRELTRLRASTRDDAEQAWLLVIESLIFHT
jgi:DNA-binding PadR family transcriptional regulator